MGSSTWTQGPSTARSTDGVPGGRELAQASQTVQHRAGSGRLPWSLAVSAARPGLCWVSGGTQASSRQPECPSAPYGGRSGSQLRGRGLCIQGSGPAALRSYHSPVPRTHPRSAGHDKGSLGVQGKSQARPGQDQCRGGGDLGGTLGKECLSRAPKLLRPSLVPGKPAPNDRLEPWAEARLPIPAHSGHRDLQGGGGALSPRAWGCSSLQPAGRGCSLGYKLGV